MCAGTSRAAGGETSTGSSAGDESSLCCSSLFFFSSTSDLSFSAGDPSELKDDDLQGARGWEVKATGEKNDDRK